MHCASTALVNRLCLGCFSNENSHLTQTQFIKKYAAIEAAYYPEALAASISKAEFQRRIEARLVEDYGYLSDDEFAQKNYGYCQIESTTADDYKYRLLDSPHGQFVASIRFIGGDLSKPSVFILHRDFELNSEEVIRNVGQFLAEKYAKFQPIRIYWFSPKWENELIEQHDFIHGDMLYLADAVSTLQQRPKPASYDRIELQPTKTLDWYETYERAYHQLLNEWPAFGEMARVESRESLQELIDQDNLYRVFVDDQWAGIIGANRHSDWFLEGYVIYEEFLFAAFRNQKLAPAMQRHFIERLHDTNALIYGTIHNGNLPSLKTALRVGRQPAGMFVYAEL